MGSAGLLWKPPAASPGQREGGEPGGTLACVQGVLFGSQSAWPGPALPAGRPYVQPVPTGHLVAQRPRQLGAVLITAFASSAAVSQGPWASGVRG